MSEISKSHSIFYFVTLQFTFCKSTSLVVTYCHDSGPEGMIVTTFHIWCLDTELVTLILGTCAVCTDHLCARLKMFKHCVLECITSLQLLDIILHIT